MEPRLILFDVDGTLIDTAGAGRRAAEVAFERVFGVSDAEEASRRVPFQGKTDPVIFEELARALGVDGEAFAHRRKEIFEIYLTALRDILARPDPRRRILPGVGRLLDELNRLSHVHLGLLTGNVEAGARAKLGAFDLNRYFPGGGFASDHHERRAIARIALEKLSALTGVAFSAAATVVVGDTEHDVDCAHANGYRAVAVDSGWSPRDALERSKPDALLDDLEDLDASMRALAIR